jgi:hypothetical protein
MGWKANCILLSETGGPVFAKFPPHQPEKARQVLAALGLGNATLKGETDFLEAIYLPDGDIGIGAYDGGLILCGVDIELSEKESAKKMVDTLFQLYPNATILELGLHSVVNFFHYKLWVSGKIVRHFAGSADDGLVSNVGEYLPEEVPHFKKSEMRDGERVFVTEHAGKKYEYDVSAYGEELLFSVAGRFFGGKLDSCEIENLKIDLFDPPNSSPFRRKPWWKFWR